MRIAAAFLWLLVSFVVGLAAGAHWLVADDPKPIDDGWRRTTTGWERVELWGVPKKPETTHHFRPAQTSGHQRWDFHPLYLAVGQLVLAGAALWMWRYTARGKPIRGSLVRAP